MTSNTEQRPVAVITGGARGIGLATARELSSKGFDLALVDRDPDNLAKALEALGDTAVLPLVGDVSSFAETQALAGKILDGFGRIDALVNNAGISQPKTLVDISEQEWDRTIAVTLKSCFNWCKAVVPAMLAAGSGRIVSVSSTSAVTGAGPNAVSKFAYCASKAGILGLTRGLARELAPTITVNAVCPGLIGTDMTAGLIDRRGPEMIPTIPLARSGSPEDVAVVIAFLVTAKPCFMTGEVVDIDGGAWIN